MKISIGKVNEDGFPSAPIPRRRKAVLGAGGLLFPLSLLLTQTLACPHSTTGITRNVVFSPLRKMSGIARGGMHKEDDGAGPGAALSDAPLLDSIYPSPVMSGRCRAENGCFSHGKVLPFQGRTVTGQAE